MPDTTQIREHLRRWHGFKTHVDALKAGGWLLGVAVAGVVFGLDQRYAPKNVEVVAISTWQLMAIREIEDIQTRLCHRETDRDYRSELNRRLAKLVADYRHRLQEEPFVPECSPNGDRRR